ncbi:MAG: hypothetical protein WDM86_06090 [Rhizomicrobium sp.]
MSARFDIGAASARLSPGRPLVIVDADEVLLRFVDGFDRFLRNNGLYLDLSSYRLHGNVKRLDDNTPVLDVEVTALLDAFRGDLDSLDLVEGAADALASFGARADVVVLTNISEAQAPARLRNLQIHGLHFPVVANSGPKGPAVKALTSRAAASFFVDDIPQHLASVAEAAPEVFRIHLIGDERLKPLLPPATHAHLRANDWAEAGAFVHARLDEAGH